VAVPLFSEPYVLTPRLAVILYTPIVIATIVAARFWRSPLGGAVLQAVACDVFLRTAAMPLLFPLGFHSRFDLWVPVIVCLPVAAFWIFWRSIGTRPATVIAAASLSWWFVHTFSDISYYTNERWPATFTLAIAFLCIAWIPRAAILWAGIEPLLVTIGGWLVSVPFYKVHTANLRVSDFERALFSVALPCAILGVTLAILDNKKGPRSEPV
jgi:hypothetical protein